MRVISSQSNINDTRTVTKFVVWKTIGDETRFLETASWVETYQELTVHCASVFATSTSKPTVTFRAWFPQSWSN